MSLALVAAIALLVALTAISSFVSGFVFCLWWLTRETASVLDAVVINTEDCFEA